MKCPACERDLTTMTAGPITVDVCSGGCGGIWFDHFELQKIDEQSESAGAELLDLPRDPAVSIDLERRRSCPKCGPDFVMLRHFTSVARKVTIDECPNCGGIFLDPGELAMIRAEYPSEEERHRAAQAYFSELFDERLASERSKGEAELASAQRFAHAFRLICPSYWLPGKQSGAAF
jgi:Zn-finger nucleic acid-binding protein